MNGRKPILYYVKQRVDKCGVSRAKLADRAGVSKSWLDKVMQGRRENPQLNEVQKLIFALDLIEEEQRKAS